MDNNTREGMAEERDQTDHNSKVVPMYNNLDEILSDLQQQKRHLTIMEKLYNTIQAGRYIVEGTGKNIDNELGNTK